MLFFVTHDCPISNAYSPELARLNEEYEAKGFKIGFLNPSDELKVFLSMFHLSDAFKIFTNEEVAISELNQ